MGRGHDGHALKERADQVASAEAAKQQRNYSLALRPTPSRVHHDGGSAGECGHLLAPLLAHVARDFATVRRDQTGCCTFSTHSRSCAALRPCEYSR